MARVNGPLMSMEASGTVAGAVTFSTWKGIPYVRRHATPMNPSAPKQVSMRAMMRFLAQTGMSSVGTDQAAWDAAVASLKMSQFNLFVKKNQQRWRDFKSPSALCIPTEAGVAPAAGVITATGGVRCATLSIADGAQAPDYGWLIFKQDSMAPTPTWDELAYVVGHSGTPTIAVITPLPASTWHFKCIGFMTTGLKGATSADANCVVT